MNDLIYVVCACLQKESGGCDYDPAIDPASDKIQMLACDNLVQLQRENAQAIEALREIADVVIVSITLAQYNELDEQLNSLMKDVDDKLDEAVIKLADAYKLMGIDIDINILKEKMMAQATCCGSAGKVLNENLEIVDRADDYITSSGMDDYYDDEDDYDDDDDYDEEDEDSCYSEDDCYDSCCDDGDEDDSYYEGEDDN